MKITIDIPDALFRSAQSAAEEQGISLGDLVCEALTEKLRIPAVGGKPWMQSFGKLARLGNETQSINQIIEREFGQVEPEDWT